MSRESSLNTNKCTKWVSYLQRIKDIEAEMARTQINKATMSHLCRLKAQLARLKTQVLEASSKSGPKGEGFDVQRYGDSRLAVSEHPMITVYATEKR